MKRSILFAVISFLVAAPSMLMAQSSFRENHAEVGVFADYMRFDPTDPKINFVGLGARLGVNVHPNIQLEGEMNYDFERSYVTTSNNSASGSLVTTRLRPLTGLFGPKFQAGSSGPVRIFATGKIGFINFSNSAGIPTGTTVGNTISNVPYGDTHVAFYPGVGLEAFAGPVGLRLDVGDEIFLSNGTHNNLRVTFGPHFRF
jgi:Outer membrane protein beta-barrel domain